MNFLTNIALTCAPPSEGIIVPAILLVVSFLLGVVIGTRLSKGSFKSGLILFLVFALLPLLLWVLDGSVSAQSITPTLEDPWPGGCVDYAEYSEPIFTQLARLNYGAWYFLVITPVVAIVSFFSIATTRRIRTRRKKVGQTG